MPPKRSRDINSPLKTLKRPRSRTVFHVNEPSTTPIIIFSSSSIPPDVEITIFTDVYHLHSTNLRHNSPFFDKSLSGVWWREGTAPGDADDKIRYRYRLKLDEQTPAASIIEPVAARRKETDISTLTLRDDKMDMSVSHLSIPDISMTEAPSRSPSPPPPASSGVQVAMNDLQQAYSTLFHIFYNKCSDLPCYSLSSIKMLVAVADQYRCLPAVAGAIELLLIKWSRCHGKLEDHPTEVVQLAIKIRSKVLYNDAFVHLVGQFDIYWGQKHTLPRKVRGPALEEYFRIVQMRTNIDRLIGWYAATRSSTEYFSGVTKTLGAIWEQWIADRRNGEAQMYREMDRIVSPAKEFTDTVMRRDLKMLVLNKLKLDRVEYGHLTCADTRDQFPWHDADDW